MVDKIKNEPEWMPENPYPEPIDNYTFYTSYETGCRDTAKAILKWLFEHCRNELHGSEFHDLNHEHAACKLTAKTILKRLDKIWGKKRDLNERTYFAIPILDWEKFKEGVEKLDTSA